jgi:anti-anti-sigma factor
MPIETRKMDSGVAVVTVSGRLVLGRDVERLETVIDQLLKQDQKRFVFDLSTLDYADSSGIGTLVACLTHIKKAGGELRMAGANARMLRLFQMTGVNHLMSMYPTVTDASAV